MSPVTADSPSPAVPATTAEPSPPLEGPDTPRDLAVTCAVCGATFKAKRPTAQCCSGKCRITLSRARRVAKVASSLAVAEASLAHAATALRKVRELVEAGGGKLAP